ncbi:uncharacterized protein CIMG_12982 [Coccidioides immitis RS]|uniref:Uncharacterized protein n=1 Tax=Coccidioides immitis (strain RS) TaxID=246410 RepID=A0A0D8JU15_COCIM|nr:uncharacterized protein CIMG_12982 [Coccidioides immitis RS]KJF60461.1 hypothetical protein CIMG_12982 [Coccidioides immitis RS]
MSIRSHGFETGQSQPPFGFTSMLANSSSQSEALKHHSERITAMSAHQTLQDLGNDDEFIISPKSDEEIPQHEHKESVMAVHSERSFLIIWLTSIEIVVTEEYTWKRVHKVKDLYSGNYVQLVNKIATGFQQEVRTVTAFYVCLQAHDLVPCENTCNFQQLAS